MEQKISLIIGESGQITFETSKIKGKLDTVIVSVAQLLGYEKTSLIIQSELGYLILKKDNIEFIKYLAPRTRAVSMLSDHLSAQDVPNQEKFNLNEKLVITALGPKNVEVNLILRFD